MTTKLETKRQSLLRRIGKITSLRQGSLTEQYYPSTSLRAGTKKRTGPYYVLTSCRDGKKKCERISQSDAPKVEALIRNYQKMKDLFDELLDVTEQITQARGRRGE